MFVTTIYFQARCGLLTGNTNVIFEKFEDSTINLVGKSKGYVERIDLIRNWLLMEKPSLARGTNKD